MKFLIGRISENRTGFLLAFVAVLLVIGWRVMAIRHDSIPGRDWRKAALELGSVPQFRRERAMVVNHANTCIVYDQDVEKNIGFYFCDITSGKKTFLCDRIVKKNNVVTSPLGWSPDDSLLIYRTPVENNPTELKFVICDGKTGAALKELKADANLTGFAWLSSSVFVYGMGSDLAIVQKVADGTWVKSKRLHGILKNAHGLTAISATSVAWQEQQKGVKPTVYNGTDQPSSISLLDINSGSVQTIWESTTNQLVEFTYSSESGEFLLNCLDATGQYLIRFNPFRKWTADGGRVVGGKHELVKNITWEKDSPRYAFLNDDGLGAFDIKANTNSDLIHLPWHGGVTQFALFGDDLFIVGNPENESPGIWHYNLVSKSLNSVILEAAGKYQYAKAVQSASGLTTNSTGGEVGYYLWKPADLVPGKKYPIIFTQTVPEWLPYQEAAANAGYYFVAARRSSWGNDELQNWGDDVMSVYKTLLKDPQINMDTNQMYLWGRSAETAPLSALFEQNPDLWKGLIIFDPGGLLNLEQLRQKRLFFITGRDSPGAQELLQYQTQAYEMGVPLKLILQDHIAHVSMSLDTESQRTMRFTQFLLKNRN